MLLSKHKSIFPFKSTDLRTNPFSPHDTSWFGKEREFDSLGLLRTLEAVFSSHPPGLARWTGWSRQTKRGPGWFGEVHRSVPPPHKHRYCAQHTLRHHGVELHGSCVSSPCQKHCRSEQLKVSGLQTQHIVLFCCVFFPPFVFSHRLSVILTWRSYQTCMRSHFTSEDPATDLMTEYCRCCSHHA